MICMLLSLRQQKDTIQNIHLPQYTNVVNRTGRTCNGKPCFSFKVSIYESMFSQTHQTKNKIKNIYKSSQNSFVSAPFESIIVLAYECNSIIVRHYILLDIYYVQQVFVCLFVLFCFVLLYGIWLIDRRALNCNPTVNQHPSWKIERLLIGRWWDK